MSEINLGLYRTFVQPWVRSWANEASPNGCANCIPLRLQYEMFSHANPFMRPLLSSVEDVRKNRQPVAKDNAFWQAQEQLADWIETSLDAYRDLRDHMSEATVPRDLWLAACAGHGRPQGVRCEPAPQARRRTPRTCALVAQRIEELKDGIAKGGPREAVLRALLYIRMPEGVVDERGFNLLRRMREEAGKGLTLAAFKKLVREQFFMLLLDERRAVEAIPAHARTGIPSSHRAWRATCVG